jgi:hypothetical protein
MGPTDPFYIPLGRGEPVDGALVDRKGTIPVQIEQLKRHL